MYGHLRFCRRYKATVKKYSFNNRLYKKHWNDSGEILTKQPYLE